MKISVLTVTYNAEQYIEKAIESVLQQNYNNWEHIIMDGGSTDGTLDLIKKYNHIIWKSEKDKGQSDAMNKAFELSTGDVIVYLNADDFFEPNVFNQVIQAFENDKYDMVVGNGKFVVNGVTQNEWHAETEYLKCLLHFKYTFPLNPVSYFYKRAVQQQIGGFNLCNKYTMDYEFLLHALKRFKVKKIEKSLGYYAFDGTNKTSTVNAFMECRKTAIAFCKQHDWIGFFYYKTHQYISNILFWYKRNLQNF